ncbi:MAG: response regulator transcription factor [Verrucomicrobia bacterium]|nr:response regulator transcription factor [Verrucomicrobiota bacterium]
MSTRLLLVDDHRLFRDGLRLMLSQRAGFTVVGEAADGQAALECVEHGAPDLVLMDLHLPDGSGLEVSRQLLARHPALRILVLSANPDPAFVSEALQLGVAGYVLKTSAAEELFDAIEAVMRGKTYLCPDIATVVVGDYRKMLAARTGSATPALSAREREVLRLTADGLRTKEIAAQLGVSVKTVETYRARLMTKLGCGSTAELTRYAVREGIVKA